MRCKPSVGAYIKESYWGKKQTENISGRGAGREKDP